MLGHIIFNIRDIEISEVFYDIFLHKLGRETRRKADEKDCIIVSYGYPEKGYSLMIRQDLEKTSQKFVRNIGLDHLCFRAKDKEHCDKLYTIIQETGCTITRPPRAYPEYSENYYAFYFRDPDGFPLEIACS